MVILTFVKGSGLTDQHKDMIKDFIPFACHKLNLKNRFSVSVMPSDTNNTIAGVKEDLKKAVFIPSKRHMEVYVKNRHILDILVSIAHEMVHLMQLDTGKKWPDTFVPYSIKEGDPGYDLEYEAYGLSGVIVRAFGGAIDKSTCV